MGFMDWLSEQAQEVENFKKDQIAKQGTSESWYAQAADGLGNIYNDVADSAGRVANRVGNVVDDATAYAAEKAAEVEAYKQANRDAYNNGTSKVAQAKKAYEDMMLSMQPEQGPQTWHDQTIAAQALGTDPYIPALSGAMVAKKGLGKLGQLYDDLFKGTKQLKVPTGDITKGVKQSEFPMHPSRKKAIFNKAIADEQDKRALEIIMAERTAGNNARNYGRSNYGL